MASDAPRKIRNGGGPNREFTTDQHTEEHGFREAVVNSTRNAALNTHISETNGFRPSNKKPVRASRSHRC
jgi:hypothetical protein